MSQMSYLDFPLGEASLEARAQDPGHPPAFFCSGVGQIAGSEVRQANLFLVRRNGDDAADCGELELRDRAWSGRLLFEPAAFGLLMRAFFAPAETKLSVQFFAHHDGDALKVRQLSFGVTRLT